MAKNIIKLLLCKSFTAANNYAFNAAGSGNNVVVYNNILKSTFGFLVGINNNAVALMNYNDLYSDYALRNFQEFWAESVEIFFEKPVEMESHYPQLYQTMKGLLNQDPINKNPSMIS